ncbi:MAG: LptF/LptG family permease [Candidatus Edwardsbacteria bacterium]|nr:LptF/LptG family permease [Candidatus Edwardsbacteria bacterium]MBU2593864.1 LptF/LptG family permease [Candidatus Edwardsbacteria bacterium]
MSMKIIDRYLIKGHALPFFLALTVLTFVLLMDRLFELINMIIQKKVPILIVSKVFFLSLPYMLTMTIPMAVLVAVIMTYGRLAQDNELTAIKSSGTPFIRLIIAPFLAGIILTAGLYFFNDRLMPETNHMVKNLLMDISETKPTLQLKENIFITDFPDYNILIRRIDPKTSELGNVTIYEQKGNSQPRTILASKGRLMVTPQAASLRLELMDGEIHQLDPEDKTRYHRISFKKHILYLPMDPQIQHQVRTYRSDREMSSGMMQQVIANIRKELKPLQAQLADSSSLPPPRLSQLSSEVHNRILEIRRYQVEIQKKMAIPAACLVFILIGAPLGIITRKGNLGVSFGLSLGFFVLYYIALIGGEELADRQILSPVLAMWAANMVLGACGLILLFWKNYEFSFKKNRYADKNTG